MECSERQDHLMTLDTDDVWGSKEAYAGHADKDSTPECRLAHYGSAVYCVGQTKASSRVVHIGDETPEITQGRWAIQGKQRARL